MPILQNSIVAVGLAVLSALTLVAYRHPDAFRKLASALFLGALAFIIGAQAFNFGTLAARDAVSVAKDLESVATRVDQVIRGAEVPQLISVGAPLVFVLYMLFLMTFRSLGLTKDQPPPKRR